MFPHEKKTLTFFIIKSCLMRFFLQNTFPLNVVVSGLIQIRKSYFSFISRLTTFTVNTVNLVKLAANLQALPIRSRVITEARKHLSVLIMNHSLVF